MNQMKSWKVLSDSLRAGWWKRWEADIAKIQWGSSTYKECSNESHRIWCMLLDEKLQDSKRWRGIAIRLVAVAPSRSYWCHSVQTHTRGQLPGPYLSLPSEIRDSPEIPIRGFQEMWKCWEKLHHGFGCINSHVNHSVAGERQVDLFIIMKMVVYGGQKETIHLAIHLCLHFTCKNTKINGGS